VDGAEPLNIKRRLFRPGPVASLQPNVVCIVGTAMNTGKTTVLVETILGLRSLGLRVAACKLTGGLSHRDALFMESAGAVDIRDFSDYGFPSTVGCDANELVSLFNLMVGDAQRSKPDVVLIEIADGILQPETAILLREEAVLAPMRGAILTASCSASALHGLHVLESQIPVLAVSGAVTNAPLFVAEIEARAEVKVVDSQTGASELAGMVVKALA
jgi:hypothetical protein